MKLHKLNCGYIQVAESVPFGNKIDIISAAKQLYTPQSHRIKLPVWVYLIEHPRGLILVDTGWCRDISPDGVYDSAAVDSVLPKQLAAMYRPYLPKGMAVHEHLAAMGIDPECLDYVLLSHLDADHVAGLKHIKGAKHIIVSEDEYFWSCRTVYKARQPMSLWADAPIERRYYCASTLGPRKWAIDLFGDESVQMVNLPGHTDGQAAIIVRNGSRFVLLAADAAFSPRNWREMITPGYGFDRDMQLKSLRFIAQMAEDPGCVAVLCSHDADMDSGTIEF